MYVYRTSTGSSLFGLLIPLSILVAHHLTKEFHVILLAVCHDNNAHLCHHHVVAYVDLLKTSLVGQVSTEICAINIENFEATCTYEGSVSNDTLVCPCCTLCEAL